MNLEIWRDNFHQSQTAVDGVTPDLKQCEAEQTAGVFWFVSEDQHKGRPWGCRKKDTIPMIVLSRGHQTHLGGVYTADNINKFCFGHMLPDLIWVISASSFHMQ